MTLYPVLIEIPHAPDEKPPERMIKQREYARRALRNCAKLTGAPEDGWTQAEGGAPLPNGEYFWSISHTRGLAAAVIAKTPIGIDVERIKERRQDLFDEIGTEGEWQLLGGKTWPNFFKLWTAKEATVKANSKGIAHIADCKLIQLSQDNEPFTPSSLQPTVPKTATILYQTKNWTIHHHINRTDTHIAALATTETSPVCWNSQNSVE